MIKTSEISLSNQLLGLGLMLGVAFLFAFLVSRNKNGENELNFSLFVGFLTLMNAFVVWAGLLYEWTLILCVVFLGVVLVFELKNRRGGSE